MRLEDADTVADKHGEAAGVCCEGGTVTYALQYQVLYQNHKNNNTIRSIERLFRLSRWVASPVRVAGFAWRVLASR